jgi:outer membrane lipoprotein-sorting protein
MKRLALLALCLSGLTAQADSLPELLSRMDRAAGDFRGMTAKLRRASYTAVIKDLSEEKGSIAMKSQKQKDMQVLVDFTSPDVKTWAFRGRKAELFIPKINTVQEYDLGKHSRLIDQFLLLGFGSSSKDLARTYDLKYGGEESIEGTKTSKLELVPKSEDARQHLKRVEIWFGQETGYPVQQKFYLGSGDYMLVNYAETKLDANLPDAAVRLKLPANVKREYPQK